MILPEDFGIEIEPQEDPRYRPQEMTLWVQMINVALFDYLSWVLHPGGRNRLRRKRNGLTAQQWIFGNQKMRFNFDDLSLAVGMSPDRVRAQILKDPSGVMSRLSVQAFRNKAKPAAQPMERA